MQVRIAPSILSADFGRLAEQVREAERELDEVARNAQPNFEEWLAGRPAPSEPALVGSIEVSGALGSIGASGDLAVIEEPRFPGDDILRLIDVSVPSNPAVAGSLAVALGG